MQKRFNGDLYENINAHNESNCSDCTYCGSPNLTIAQPLNDIFLWMHLQEAKSEGDWPAAILENQFNLLPNRDIHYTEGINKKQALSPDAMSILYKIWDGLLYLSGGEGFGLPAWEAMCSGIPVVYTDYSSHAEFLGEAKAGLPVQGILQPEAHSCIWRIIADAAQAIIAVRKLYFNRTLCRQLGANGRAYVQNYTTEIQARKWNTIMQQLCSEK
jgi:glycosyltransferase involved in cell wall biosynthesis